LEVNIKSYSRLGRPQLEQNLAGVSHLQTTGRFTATSVITGAETGVTVGAGSGGGTSLIGDVFCVTRMSVSPIILTFCICIHLRMFDGKWKNLKTIDTNYKNGRYNYRCPIWHR
jgi:hypothetical protein